MTQPFMRAYTEQLVRACHKRGAMAIGGMAAAVPNRKDADANAIAFEKVRADKTREAGDGFDGSWVAHPDLVPVCREVFDGVLGDRPNQLDRLREDVTPDDRALIDIASTTGTITEQGIRNNIEVGIRYIESWLRGNGAVAIHNLMEDAATAEISRSQLWQWIFSRAITDDGDVVTREWVEDMLDEEFAKLERFEGDRFADARDIFEEVTLGNEFPAFLTLPAYDRFLHEARDGAETSAEDNDGPASRRSRSERFPSAGLPCPSQQAPRDPGGSPATEHPPAPTTASDGQLEAHVFAKHGPELSARRVSAEASERAGSVRLRHVAQGQRGAEDERRHGAKDQQQRAGPGRRTPRGRSPAAWAPRRRRSTPRPGRRRTSGPPRPGPGPA